MTTDSTPTCGLIRNYKPNFEFRAVDYPCVLDFGHPGRHEDRDGDNFTDATPPASVPANELRESLDSMSQRLGFLEATASLTAQALTVLTEIRDRLPAPPAPAPECRNLALDGHSRCTQPEGHEGRHSAGISSWPRTALSATCSAVLLLGSGGRYQCVLDAGHYDLHQDSERDTWQITGV